jgi:hypothetical protein
MRGGPSKIGRLSDRTSYRANIASPVMAGRERHSDAHMMTSLAISEFIRELGLGL